MFLYSIEQFIRYFYIIKYDQFFITSCNLSKNKDVFIARYLVLKFQKLKYLIISTRLYTYYYYWTLILFTESWDYRLALNVSRRGQAVPIRSALRTSYIILILIGLFLASWTPYAVVTCFGQFADNGANIPPWVSALPALCAKVGSIWITVFINKK